MSTDDTQVQASATAWTTAMACNVLQSIFTSAAILSRVQKLCIAAGIQMYLSRLRMQLAGGTAPMVAHACAVQRITPDQYARLGIEPSDDARTLEYSKFEAKRVVTVDGPVLQLRYTFAPVADTQTQPAVPEEAVAQTAAEQKLTELLSGKGTHRAEQELYTAWVQRTDLSGALRAYVRNRLLSTIQWQQQGVMSSDTYYCMLEAESRFLWESPVG